MTAASQGRQVRQPPMRNRTPLRSNLSPLTELPVSPLFNYVVILFFDDTRLGGVQGNLTDEHPFRTMYWKKP